MNTFMRDSGPEYPCDMEPPTDSSPHTCVHFPPGHEFHYGGRCWCQPRELVTAMLQQSLLATERRLRPDNVVQFPVRARIKGRFSA